MLGSLGQYEAAQFDQQGGQLVPAICPFSISVCSPLTALAFGLEPSAAKAALPERDVTHKISLKLEPHHPEQRTGAQHRHGFQALAVPPR